ncbi:MAG: hypothetical protein P8J33_07100 [Pirellulaceae bacterium]|nr:hypothetical protein [Pirellulaceae bacterium]
MNRMLIILCSVTILVTGLAMTWRQTEGPRVVLPQDAIVTAQRDFMRSKLMYSQLILEGLTTHNFDMIHEAIANMKMVTEGELWVTVDDDPEYIELTQAFKKAAVRLQEAVDTKSVDGTAMRFYQLNTTCIDCHQYIRARGYKL